jgi:hypothetical protein
MRSVAATENDRFEGKCNGQSFCAWGWPNPDVRNSVGDWLMVALVANSPDDFKRG